MKKGEKKQKSGKEKMRIMGKGRKMQEAKEKRRRLINIMHSAFVPTYFHPQERKFIPVYGTFTLWYCCSLALSLLSAKMT